MISIYSSFQSRQGVYASPEGLDKLVIELHIEGDLTEHLRPSLRSITHKVKYAVEDACTLNGALSTILRTAITWKALPGHSLQPINEEPSRPVESK